MQSRASGYIAPIVLIAIFLAGIFFLYRNNSSDNTLAQFVPDTAPDTIKESVFKEIEKQPDLTWKPKKKKITYDISCLRQQSLVDEMIGLGSDVENEWIKAGSDAVGIEEEMKLGKEVKAMMEKEYAFSAAEKYKGRVDKIMEALLKNLDPQSPYSYEWHIVQSEDVNAFTAGAQIFITMAMIDFTESDDELAMVLSHEIHHNELGHINKQLRKQLIARNWLGEMADYGILANNILTMPFNQENEVYCDLHGLDLAVAFGYDGCQSITFWNRMGKNETQDKFTKFLRTHPFSKERVGCLRKHIDVNYTVSCAK